MRSFVGFNVVFCNDKEGGKVSEFTLGIASTQKKTSDINIVRTVTCQHMFGFELPNVLLARRTGKFLEKMKKIRVEVNHFKIDCSFVMFFTKLIIAVFTLCLFIVFYLFIKLYVCLLQPFLW